ncbi:MAG TPA: DUF6339 family protein [Allosphingosinicella sp.]|nr:DUF6339 family protein [Allosphingosinicella sp.]
MKARLLRSSALEGLRAKVETNLERYRSGDFSELDVDSAMSFEVDAEIDAAALTSFSAPEDESKGDVANARIIHSAFSSVTPYLARDERLWAFYTHTTGLEYARKRWPIPTDEAVAAKHIRQHFFAKDKRQVERDNALSRLWWVSHLCGRVDGLSLEDALAAFLFKTDVRANLIERPTSAQTVTVFSAVINKLHQSYKGDQALFERARFRALMRGINAVGGYRLLEFLETQEVEALVTELAGT